MFQPLRIVCVLLVAVAMAQWLAHALEYPGKLRLKKEQYLAVQPIYCPGFTFAGASEPLSIVTLLVLTFPTPDARQFWPTPAGFIMLVTAVAQ